MKYLFGDSTPFPLPFDFLRTLESFMTEGTRVVLLEHQARKAAEEALHAAQGRARATDELGRFHDGVITALSESAVPPFPPVVEYAQRLRERALSFVEDLRRDAQQGDAADAARAKAERERATAESARHLRTFFQSARLPVLGTSLFVSLADGKPAARASLLHPGGIRVSFVLGTAKAPAWSAPRKLSEVAGHLELMVGINKSWFGNKVTREPVRLDDWLVGSAELSDATATIAVRKKLDQKDTLIFKLRRHQGALFADVDRPGDANANLIPPAAEASDLPHLDRLWTSLRATFDEIIEERASITSVHLDDEDVLANGLGQRLVERIVAELSPLTHEVARRSPNVQELSLKRERDSGRREELYLKRDQLLAALAPLPREGRAVFAPLGLEDWLPGMTERPPAVSAGTLEMPAFKNLPEMPRQELTSLDFEEG